MKTLVLLLNVFIITSTLMYTSAEQLQKLVNSIQLETQISDDSLHHQDNNQANAISAKRIPTENIRKDTIFKETSIFKPFKNLGRLRDKFKNYKFKTVRPYVGDPRACPKGTILRRGKCVPALSTQWW